MKLEKLSFNPKYDNLTNVKNSIVLHALSYAKIYELLHKQIWRKAPSRVWTYNIPQIPTFNGRAVTFIRGWNIKSESKNPYTFATSSSWHQDFGLNQLFMEQDYRKVYDGDPGDGIYHDDCYIQPKAMELLSGFIEMWSYLETEGESGYIKHDFKFQKQDAQGNVLINSVRIEVYNKPMVKADGTNDTVLWKRIVVDSVKDGIVYYELDQADIPNASWYAGFLNFTKTEKTWVVDKAVKESEFIATHGALVWKHNTSKESHPVFLSGNIDSAKQGGRGCIMVFTDGTAIEYVPYTVDAWGDDYSESLAHYKILPMMYTDTGDLVMNRIEFVEKWNDYFELIVHEDSEWWQSLVTPIVAIIVAIIAYYTGYYYGGWETLAGAATFVGGAVSAVGILANEKSLMNVGAIIGGIGALSGSIQEGAKQAIAQEAMVRGFSERTAAQVGQEFIKDATFTQLFSTYVSGAGLTNWLSVGSKAFYIGSSLDSLSFAQNKPIESEETKDTMQVSLSTSEDEEVYSPEKWIKNVIDIL